jgi:hypothetical protein
MKMASVQFLISTSRATGSKGQHIYVTQEMRPRDLMLAAIPFLLNRRFSDTHAFIRFRDRGLKLLCYKLI